MYEWLSIEKARAAGTGRIREAFSVAIRQVDNVHGASADVLEILG